jgi:hypothetical protein
MGGMGPDRSSAGMVPEKSGPDTEGIAITGTQLE